MFYDASLLQELGLTISMEPTWEEFKEIGQKVYEATGIKTSYCWQITYAETLRNTIRGAGYEFYNEEQTALGFDDPTIIERAYQELAEAGAAEWVVDPVGICWHHWVGVGTYCCKQGLERIFNI